MRNSGTRTGPSRSTVRIRPKRPGDHRGIIAVAEALKPWFDSIARRRAIPVDIRHQEGHVAVQDGRVVGFVTMCVTEGCLHINWLGVLPEFHGQGIGRRLLDRVESAAVRKGIDEITVYTLGAGSGYKPYESTRAFYFRNGFETYRTSQTDSPRCPEEIELSKKVKRRRGLYGRGI